jgi:hypothetical protein
MFPGFLPLWKQAEKAGMSLLMWRLQREGREQVDCHFWTWTHKKSDEANRTSFQNVPHPVFIDSFGVLTIVKLIKIFHFFIVVV